MQIYRLIKSCEQLNIKALFTSKGRTYSNKNDRKILAENICCIYFCVAMILKQTGFLSVLTSLS